MRFSFRYSFFLIVSLLAIHSGIAAAASPTRTILVVGDSLSAAYGLPREQGWVHLLAEKTTSVSSKYRIVNASISGETSSGGAQRLPALLGEHKPVLVIIELGGNDALRGLALTQTQAHFERMVQLSKAAKANVLLLPMQMPPNYGVSYAKGFEAIYPAVAKKYQIKLAPFILSSFANKPDFFQRDRIHPTAQAQPIMLETVWPAIKLFLK
jgi:acyl-CoA thioesterase I